MQEVVISQRRLNRWNLRDARRAAHRKFDKLWKSPKQGGMGLMTRTEAYRQLAKVFKKSREDAHISKLTKRECLVLYDKASEWERIWKQ